MLRRARTWLRSLLRQRGNDPVAYFHAPHYLRHNARRLEHLASLGLTVAGKTVLEVGAGIGDHTHYYLDRSCRVTITEARPDNLRYLRERYPEQDVRSLDLEQPAPLAGAPFDIVHCYGVLYHLRNPAKTLEFLSASCREMLLLETCVSFGSNQEIHPVTEDKTDHTQSCSGVGCRPTRAWVFAQLQAHLAHVYVPTTQPNDAEFPLDWTAPERHPASLSRAVFIAARAPLANAMLSPALLERQSRHP